MGYAERANPNSLYNRKRKEKRVHSNKELKERGFVMANDLTGTAKRAGRVTVATILAGLVSQLTGDVKWLALAPAISALGKFLRDVIGLKYIFF